MITDIFARGIASIFNWTEPVPWLILSGYAASENRLREMKYIRPSIFPLFNTLVGAMFGALTGYYLSHLAGGLLFGAIAGLAIGIVIEAVLGLWRGHWLYRRRVLLTVLLEIPVTVFVAAPFAYAYVETMPDPHPVCCQTPLDFGAETYETLRIPVAEGVTLVGWFVPPREKPGAVVILLHGSRGDRLGTAWHARQLIAAGYGVLLYDQRGLGESSGDTLSFGWLDGPDLLRVLDELEGRPEVDASRIGVVGLSLGGHIALNAAYQAPERFQALWLDGIEAQRMDDFPQPDGPAERFALSINSQILKMAELRLGRDAPPAISTILKELSRPHIMIVGAGRDDFERRVQQGYRDVVGPNTEMWLIEDAWHVGGPLVATELYRQRMLEFFAATLGAE